MPDLSLINASVYRAIRCQPINKTLIDTWSGLERRARRYAFNEQAIGGLLWLEMIGTSGKRKSLRELLSVNVSFIVAAAHF